MNTGRVTAEALRRMPMNKRTAFLLPKHEPELSRTANSGKTLAYRMQRELGCTISAETDFENAILYLTKSQRNNYPLKT